VPPQGRISIGLGKLDTGRDCGTNKWQDVDEESPAPLRGAGSWVGVSVGAGDRWGARRPTAIGLHRYAMKKMGRVGAEREAGMREWMRGVSRARDQGVGVESRKGIGRC